MPSSASPRPEPARKSSWPATRVSSWGFSGGVSTVGDYVVAPGNVAVNFEQDMTVDELMEAMVDTLSNAGIEAYSSVYIDGATNSDVGRMTLPDATSFDFSGAAAFRVMPGSPGVTAGNYAVPFHAGQTADTVAQAMTDAISQANADGKTPATASRKNAAVVLGKLTGDTTITTTDTPLTLAGGSTSGADYRAGVFRRLALRRGLCRRPVHGRRL